MPAYVFMLAPGTRIGTDLNVSGFMKAQADSLQMQGCTVQLAVVDDRTSVCGLFRNIVRLRRELVMSNASIVHAMYGSATALVAAILSPGRSLVISFCGDDLLGTPVDGWRRRVRERLARWIGILAALFADVLIVKSRNLQLSLPAILQRRCVILPNGVDCERFKPGEKSDARALLGWPECRKIVLFNASHGDNRAVKNAALAWKAMRLVVRRRPDVELIELTSSTSAEVALAMKAADCLLVTSLHEGSPNIVKEAMATGLPVVSVACGDVAERLRNVTPGEVCPYDREAIADAVVRVLGCRSRSNGRQEIVAQRLTLGDVAEQLMCVYETVRPVAARAVEAPSTPSPLHG